ncbi:chondroitin sulfate synthase 2 [Sitophilus oryzae]|uniref:Hexosyltransferase n=1 Tax=Sitophilus oryzae TaxID=7048 RepID=A0A6J2X8R1_SITOR|nr:chondroitin sulfate synthase 2 [Sitophilus oryzae]
MLKTSIKFVSENLYVFLGIIIGLYISTFVSTSLDISCETPDTYTVNNKIAQKIINDSVNHLAPKVLPEKPLGEKKSKFIRPRYYSTELGIREKLFVGIFTSEDNVNSQALHINKTIGHIVDKIKFFITAQYKLKTKFNLTGLVGFTDARSKYRPFQVIKYVGDTFAQDYDYYFFTTDHTFINIHKLKDIVSKISVSADVYLGTKVHDGSYCNIDAGILISNSVLKSLRENLEWCIMNAVTDDYSENFGRCVYHSLGLTCQFSVQDQAIFSHKLKHFDLDKHLHELSKSQEFINAVTVRPVLKEKEFYILNSYFLKQRLATYQGDIAKISSSLRDSWPPGQRSGAKPATRFDMPRQYYFNMTHIFFPDDFVVIREHTEPELLDLKNILEEITAKVAQQYPKQYKFRRLVNAYKTFDLSRGADYTFDIGFRDLASGKEIVKRYDVCKPLGKVEFISAPYVTENTRVTIILPIQENEASIAMHFLDLYSTNIMEKKDKTFLMLVFLYQYKSSSKGSDDIFQELKDFVNKVTNRYKNDDVKVGWVSIRLPEYDTPITFENTKALKFATVDLALKKIGLNSLTLILDIYTNITVDFLNRVRMNTIENYQVFSAIPFRQYDPVISQYTRFDVNKISGHFDREEYKYIAFYGKDYVAARKKFQPIIPLIRVDNDISKLLNNFIREKGNIFEMFVQYGAHIHCMRATEMNLKILYHNEPDEERKNKFYGNDAQLAKLLLTKQENIPELQ